MKYILGFVFCFLTSAAVQAQEKIAGAWQNKQNGTAEVLLFQDGYFTASQYNDGQFLGTWGGRYSIENGKIKVQVEFNSTNKEEAGTTRFTDYKAANGKLTFGQRSFSNIDKSKAPLAGVWKITHRKENDRLNAIHTSGPRKTLKILTGTRFQWFAINPETKEFSGTGGGTYTFKDGKYTENIEFFSRDQSRAGASLTFDGRLEDGSWHHSGLSSKGDPIYEVWGKQSF